LNPFSVNSKNALTLEQGGARLHLPSFFLNISVARRNFPLRFDEFLEKSKPDVMTLRFSNYVTVSEGGVDDFLEKV